MNHTLSDSQLEEMIKSAVNSSGPLPPDEKFSQLVSALRELQESRKAAMDSEPAIADCDPEVYEKGVSVCLVAIPKETAEVICQNITAATGCKVDWHYFGGRVHIKALRVTSQPAPVVGYVPLGDSPYDIPYSMPSNLRELIAEEMGILFSDDDAQSVWNVCRRAAMLRAQPQNAPQNIPEIIPGWIPVSERMPEKNQNVLISVNFDSDLVVPLICSARYTGSTFRRGDATVKPGTGIEEATHWMPLPAAPQEVKSES